MRLTKALQVAFCVAVLGGVVGGCVNFGDGPEGEPDWAYIDCGPVNANAGTVSGGCDGDNPPVGGNQTCGTQSGQCPCALDDYAFCGHCPTAPSGEECTYCPDGYRCSGDPCNPTCLQPSNRCDVDCGNGYCCPSQYPVCCGDTRYCGTSTQACGSPGLQPPAPGGGGNSFSCSRSDPQVDCGTSQTCDRCAVLACGGPDGSGCMFYVGGTQTFYPRSTSTADGLEAAERALTYCGCI
ncbi:MAG TPA: hypothetical protein VHO25_12500 [Polyangiaceae bacterium]|nr:hypothetical protein [Polyangiaceae bacterium]